MLDRENWTLFPDQIGHEVRQIVEELSPAKKLELLEQFPPPCETLTRNSKRRGIPDKMFIPVIAVAGCALGLSLAILGSGQQSALSGYSSLEKEEQNLIKLREEQARNIQEKETQPKQNRASLIEKTLQERLKRTYFDLSPTSWQVIELPDSVTMRVTTDIGILHRLVPDIRKAGNLVPTFASGDQPQIKHWKWGEPIRQTVKYFVLEDQTQQSVLFAMDEDNNLWPIYNSGDPDSPFVIFERNGEPVLLGRLLTEPGVVFHPPF